jgi:hypothetical protein
VEPEETAEVATDGEMEVGVEVAVVVPMIGPLGGIRRPGRMAGKAAVLTLSTGRGW